jgi:transcription initiation factor TFIIE subunit alpha
MKKNLLKIESVHNFLFNLVGGQGIEMIEILLKQGTIDEFSLAEKLDIQVNVARSLLYKLYSQKIVSFTKERDEKKGWWIYSWSIHPKRIVELLSRSLNAELNDLMKKSDKRKAVQLYKCPVCEINMPFSEAMESSFQCPSCGGMMEFQDLTDEINKFQNRIKELKNDLKDLE